MNGIRKLALALSLVAGVAVPVYPQGVAISVRNGVTDPPQCQPVSTNVFINRTSASVMKICTASNTWSPLVVSGGAGGWPLLAPNGTSAAPSYSFTNFPTLGLYANTNLALAQGTGSLLVTGTTDVPTALTTALVVAAGNIDAGSHSYKVTFVTAGGETLGGTTSNAVVADGTHAQNTLTSVPVGANPYVTQRKIYRNKVAAQTSWFLQQTIADNTSTTGVQDNTADSALGAAIPTTNTAIDTRWTLANTGNVTMNGKLQTISSATPALKIADTTGTNAAWIGDSGDVMALSVNRDPAGGTGFVDASKSSVQVNMTGAVGASKFEVFTTTSNNTTPTNNFQIYGTGVGLASGSVYRVTGDFTSASNTSLQTITGLSWVLPANTAANYPFRCEIMYNQTVAAVADQFGIQAASLAPTNIAAKADVNISASTFTAANLPTLTTTTATAIVTFTPTAITTIWNARIAGMIENPSGVANTINIMVQQSTAADLMVIKKDSYCVVGF